MADAGLPWSIPNAGFSIQPINGEFAAWSRGSSVPPDGWSVLSGTWSSTLSRCQGGTGPYAVDFGQAGIPSTLVSDYIVVLPNTRYLLSALYRIVTGSGAALSQGVRVDWYDDSRSLISSNNVDLITNTAGVWTYSGADITSPIQAVYAKVVVGRFNVNGSANLQVDAIKLDRAVYIPSGVISLDDVTDGATYARPKADGLQLGYPKLDSVIDGTLFRKVGVGYVDASNRITGVLRGTSPVAGADLFAKTLDTLDNVTNGILSRKVSASYADASGRITTVFDGTNVVGASSLFNKGLDTLDNVSNGTSYARVNAVALSAGNPKTDSLVDGTYSKVLSTHVTSGAITSLTRGGTLYATSTFFQKALDNLDNVLDGASFRKVGTAYVDSSNRVTGVLRGTSALAGADIFAKTLDTLDNVTDGASFRKVGTAYVDSSNRVTGVLRGTSPVAGVDLFAKTLDTLDNVSNGTTYARVNATALSSGNPKTDSLVDGTYAKVLADHLTSGAITSITRGGTRYASTSFFNTGLDNLSNVANGGGFNKTSSTYVNTSGQITAVRRLSADESVDNLFKKSSDTFASVAGTLSDGQLGSNVVNASNVKSQAIDWSKLDDGSPIMAWDEGRGSLLAGRVTFTNGGTLQTPEANQGYTGWAVTSGTTDFYVETDVQFRTVKDQYVSITYRTGGTTGWAASSTMVVINMGNTAQTATATMYGDGLWHTAVFDISAWTGTSTVRFDAQDGGAAIGAGATFWVANLAVGSVGVGPGGGHTLSSYRGSVGINVAKPTYQLETGGSTAQFPTLFAINATAHATSRRAAMFLGDWLVGQDSNGNGTKDFFLYNGGLTVPLVLSVGTTGQVSINQPSSGYVLRMNGISSPTAAVINSSNAAATFPSFQVANYGANGGFPAHQFYNSRGTEASPSSSNSGDVLGATIYSGRVLASFAEGARQEAVLTAAPGLTTLTTALRWYTSNAGSSTARARLSAAGRLYIGGDADAEELVEARTGTNAYGYLHSNGTIKVGTYISGEGQIGTKSNHDFALFTNSGAGRLRIMATGEVRVPALAGAGNRAVYSDANGNLTNTSSDATLKGNAQPLENVLPVVLAMRPVSFQWKDQHRFGPWTEIGFMAQEMRELVPYVVGENSDGTLTIDYPKLTAVLARAIQELKQQIDELAISRS